MESMNEIAKRMQAPMESMNEIAKRMQAPMEVVNEMAERIKKIFIDSKTVFLLSQSYGFPFEMVKELAEENHVPIDDRRRVEKEFEKHQEVSRVGAEKRFKGGLSDASDETVKLHTAAHLLNEALRKVLKKEDIHQKGSNITPSRLRFDFNFERGLTEDEIKDVEAMVNEQIKKELPIKREEMTLNEARKIGAHGVFQHKYGEKIYVYIIGDFSVEICGGPHVNNIKELGKFKIVKEQSVAAGVRRIKAILE